ncbi:hypothetical protein HYW74_04110 [Candidatus Pacearchaeota archaeon]|nr:hypothetical protein [Candidatus Pacearchaeota archaeon]
MQCINNAQCGIQSSQVICSGNNRINITQTPTCTLTNTCTTITTNTTLQNCQFGCSNGACLPQPQCTIDSQCGSVTSQLFCDGNNIMNRTQTPQCLNNNCNTQTTNTFVQNCPFGCLNAACLPQPRENDTIINITDDDFDNFNQICQASTIFNPNPERYLEIKQPIQTSLQQGHTYNFYCTYGESNQPGAPVTLTLDNSYREVEAGIQKHRFSVLSGLLYTQYQPVEPFSIGTDMHYIITGNDTYKFYARVDNQGKLYVRVKREMAGLEKWRDFTANTFTLVKTPYNKNNLCPAYDVTLFPDIYDIVNDNVFIFGKGLNEVNEVKSLNCVIKPI